MGNKKALPKELIIHPGVTLEELLDDRGMKQKELAERCGVTEKHISSVISGKSNISATFAKKLEYVFGVGMDFWLNLQVIYDKEMQDYKEVNEVTMDEIDICKHLKKIEKCIIKNKFMNNETSDVLKTIALRQFFGVANLCDIREFKWAGAFRAQECVDIDPYVIFAWQVLCEKLAEKQEVAPKLNLKELRKEIPNIKKLSLEKPNKMIEKLKDIFARCGIAFVLIHNFKGAPVQGFIKEGKNKTILGMTIRGKWVDIFWFTLFHEIGHLLHGDTKKQFLDFEYFGDSEIERKADNFAAETLINTSDMQKFISIKNYSQQAVNSFAKQQKIDVSIVWGRLAKLNELPWSAVARFRSQYEWQNEV